MRLGVIDQAVTKVRCLTAAALLDGKQWQSAVMNRASIFNGIPKTLGGRTH